MKKDLKQLFNEFLDEEMFSAKLSSDTLRGYRTVFDLFIKIMPTTTLEMLLPQTMTEFFARLEKRERNVGKNIIKTSIKKSTVATYRSKLHKFFEWLKIKRYIKMNPFEGMEYPNISYEDKKWLKKEELEKIITAIEAKIKWNGFLVHKRNSAIFHVLLGCGLRKGELLGLKTYDIDLGRKILTVRAETSKSKINRTIPIGSLVSRKLEDYLNERKKENYLTPFLFVSDNHDDKLTYHGFKHLILKLVKESDVKFHAHQLRHTFAVNMLNNGCDIAKLKQLMGHKDIRMTMTYLRCIPTSSMQQNVEMLSNLDNYI